MTIRWFAWFITGAVLWLGLTATVVPNEVVPGLGAAAIAATVAEIVRRKGRFEFRMRARWLKAAALLPGHIVRDTYLVFRTLIVRQLIHRVEPRGSFRSVTAPIESSLSAGRNLLATIGISITPNTYVVGFDEHTNDVLIHQLDPQEPDSLSDIIR